MSEDTTNVDAQDVDAEDTVAVQQQGESTEVTLEDLSEEDLRKEIKKLRRESAKHRTAKQQKDAELEEFRAWKDSQLTELERAQKKAGELESELTSLRREKNQAEAAKKAGLSLDLSDRVRGDTLEEMLEDAKRLAELFPTTVNRSSSVAGSEGKKPVGSNSKDSAEGWFKDFLSGKI